MSIENSCYVKHQKHFSEFDTTERSNSCKTARQVRLFLGAALDAQEGATLCAALHLWATATARRRLLRVNTVAEAWKSARAAGSRELVLCLGYSGARPNFV